MLLQNCTHHDRRNNRGKLQNFIPEMEMSSFWWNFHHWLHRMLSKWQLPVQPVMKISSKWWHVHFSDMVTLPVTTFLFQYITASYPTCDQHSILLHFTLVTLVSNDKVNGLHSSPMWLLLLTLGGKSMHGLVRFTLTMVTVVDCVSTKIWLANIM